MDDIPEEYCKTRKIAADDGSLSIMDRLPHEIVLNILSRLPVLSLLQAKLVSRSWKNLVSDPVLASLHCSRMSEKNPSLVLRCNFPLPTKLYFVHNLDFAENGERLKRIILPAMPSFFNVAGSCNGLLCLYDLLHKNSLYVFNPFAGSFLELPKAKQFTKYDDAALGFGFVPSTKEYKVVRVLYYSISKSDVQILNVGKSSWRTTGETQYNLQRQPSHAVVNRRLHWLTLCINKEPRQIISFDLENEQFQTIHEPNCTFLNQHCSHLANLKGSLSMAAFSSELQLDIWMMKDYGVKESWSKTFSIGAYSLVKEMIEDDEVESCRVLLTFVDPSDVRVLWMMENGEILLNYKGKGLMLFDPANCCILKEIRVKGLPNMFQPIVHIGSLNCVDGAGHM